ncbi:MAG: signal peptidase I [Opitutaceae bacterium]|nr:signal peptidase I [Opitutaceae bacterium]
MINLIQLAAIVLIIAGVWKVFTKAGQPGWAAIVPFYNIFILLKIAGRPGWWLLLFLIPLVNVIVVNVCSIDVAKAFGKGVGCGLGLALLGFIFFPILGFGSAVHQGAASA